SGPGGLRQTSATILSASKTVPIHSSQLSLNRPLILPLDRYIPGLLLGRFTALGRCLPTLADVTHRLLSLFPPQLENVFVKWAPEIRHHCSEVPIILVGTKIDLREDHDTLAQLAQIGQAPIRKEQGIKMANKIKAVNYLECSALTQQGVKNVFEETVRCVICPRQHLKKANNNKCHVM